MKITTLLFFCIALISLPGCINDPEFSDTPKIEFNNIYFRQGSSSVRDSLVIQIHFEDGDGNLGLDDRFNNEERFRQGSYFTDSDGNLVTIKHQEELNLPPFEFPFICENYRLTPRTVDFCSEAGIDPSQCDQIVNSLGIEILETGNDKIIQDTLYFEPNPNFYNYFLTFLIQVNGEFVEFDWYNSDLAQDISICGITTALNLRFPVLSDTGDNSPVEGDLTYAFTSRRLAQVFGSNRLKLRIQIQDRALNESNPVETIDFTLQEIQIN